VSETQGGGASGAGMSFMPGLPGAMNAIREAAEVAGAQSELAGDDIAMDPEGISDLASRLFGALDTIVSYRHSDFLGAPREWAIFGGMPEAQWFSYQLGAAHDVVADAVKGLDRDLEDFQVKLMDAVKTARNADESAEAELMRFANRDGSSWAMSQSAQAASQEHSAVLGDTGSSGSETASAGGSDAGASGGGTSEGATGGSGTDTASDDAQTSFE
jgi:uncharacterized membrane protein YgcG